MPLLRIVRSQSRILAALLALLICTFVIYMNSQGRSLATEPISPTARQIVEQIIAKLDGPWTEDGVDGFKDGNPDTPVTGIAVAMMSTMDVLQQAVAANANLIITHEPTYYGDPERAEDLERQGDTVTATKRAYVREHNLVIWRLHDHWHAPLRWPDPVVAGLLRQLDWQGYLDSPESVVVTIPETTVGDLAAEIGDRTSTSTIRVVGDANQTVTRVALLPGSAGFNLHRSLLQSNGVDALVIGESREWETIPYVADAVTQGQHKALIILGHVVSEQAGSEELAQWLQPLLPNLPVQFIKTADPFWSPS